MTGTMASDLNGPGYNYNRGVFYISQTSRSGDSPSDSGKWHT